MHESPGPFVWNRAGFFGTLLGATAWMPLLGIVVLSESRAAAMRIFGAFLLCVVLGLLIWSRRKTWRPYVGIQATLLVTGAAAFAISHIVSESGTDHLLDDARYGGDVIPLRVAVFVYPLLMILFALKERCSRRFSAST